jgi:hypothetical protein
MTELPNSNPNGEISTDYFLYRCYDLDKSAKSDPNVIQNEMRWPTATSNAQGLEDGENVFSLFEEAVVWYSNQYPQLAEADAITPELLNDAIMVAVMIERDLNFICKRLTKSQIPAVSSDDASSPNHPFWLSAKECLQDAFPGLAGIFLRYLHWCHSDAVLRSDTNDRPPTGHIRERKSGGPRRGGPGGGFGGGSRGRHGGGRDRGRGGDRDGRRPPRGGQRHGNNNNSHIEEEVLDEVIDAIAQLRANPQLMKIPLKPRNSFHRRLQHQHVNQEGFTSESSGEGTERHLVVMKGRG